MYIAFEGGIGAGKTTLATVLAEELGQQARLLLENFQCNAFLADFYAGRDRWALPMQLDFLVSRYEQLSVSLPSEDIIAVADHSLEKDALFANMLLGGRELDLYRRISSALVASSPSPDLVVYLEVDMNVLLERIRSRGREYESSIDLNYLILLDEAYQAYISRIPDCRLIKISNSHNFDSPESIRNFVTTKLLKRVLEAAGLSEREAC